MYIYISSTTNKHIKRPRYRAPSVGTSDGAGERERERERKISKEFLIFGFWVSFLNIWGTYQDSFLKVICPSSQQWTHPPSHGELSRRGRGFEGDFGALHLKNWRKLPESAGTLLIFCQIFVPYIPSVDFFRRQPYRCPSVVTFCHQPGRPYGPLCPFFRCWKVSQTSQSLRLKRCLAARFTQFAPPRGLLLDDPRWKKPRNLILFYGTSRIVQIS